MNEPTDIIKKAFYLGVGIASYAVEKAEDIFTELNQQAQKLTQEPDFAQKLRQIADEMVAKRKMTAEEAQKYVEEIIAKQKTKNSPQSEDKSKEPRIIEIIEGEEDNSQQSDDLRQEVHSFEEQLHRLQKNK
jgi:polyhydroxyalkanoate synthesis regulator phasin